VRVFARLNTKRKESALKREIAPSTENNLKVENLPRLEVFDFEYKKTAPFGTA